MDYDIKTNGIKTTLIAIPIAFVLLGGFVIGFAWRGNDVAKAVEGDRVELSACHQKVLDEAQRIPAESVKGHETEVFQWVANRLNDCILTSISTSTPK